MSDFRFAFRSLLRSPGFAVSSILLLSLGLALNTALFSALYAALLKPMPYPESEHLYFVWNSYPKVPGMEKNNVSILDFRDRREQVPALARSALFTGVGVNLSTGDKVERVRALRVTPLFFPVLAVRPELGRLFVEADADPASAKTVILSHALWVTRFGRNPTILDQNVRLNGEIHRVVGVLPAEFRPPAGAASAYLPFHFSADDLNEDNRFHEYSSMIVRLDPLVSPATATEQLRVWQRRLSAQAPKDSLISGEDSAQPYLVSLRDEWVGPFRGRLWMLQAAAVAVLLIACANVANLHLARGLGRAREFAVRAALGATRRDVILPLVVENLLLAVPALILGWILGLWAMEGMRLVGVSRMLGLDELALEWPMVAATSLLLVVAVLTTGVGPAVLVSQNEPVAALGSLSFRATESHSLRRWREGLVVLQVAVASLLIIMSILFAVSLQRLSAEDPGFDPNGRLTARLLLPQRTYADSPTQAAFHGRLEAQAGALPGVEAVGMVSILPFSFSEWTRSYSIDERPTDPASPQANAHDLRVSPGYFSAMGIALVRGRGFNPGDGQGSPRVAVVDEALVRRQFPNEDPLGHTLRFDPKDPPAVIVGVVRSVRNRELQTRSVYEAVYRPLAQEPTQDAAIILRTATPPSASLEPLRRVVRDLDPEIPLFDVRTMEDRIQAALTGHRAPSWLSGAFAVSGAFLALGGLYASLAYYVARREREIGIRLALGASAGRVSSEVVRRSVGLAAVGLAIGLAVAWTGNEFVQPMLYGVQARDPLWYAVVAAGVGGMAVLAALVPARRAGRVDPVVALRAE